MTGLREVLAAALGIGFGALLVAFPEPVIRVQTAGTRPDRQPGPGGGGVSRRWRILIRLLGVAFVVGGAFFAYRILF